MTHLLKYSPSFAVRVVLLILVSGPLMSLLFIQSIPPGDHLWGESLNAGHAVLFGVIAGMLLWTLKAKSRFVELSVLRQFLTVGVTIEILGISTEFIQPYFNRDCELGDTMRCGVGVFMFLSVLAIFNHRLDAARRRIGRRVSSILLTITILALIGVSIPADSWALAYLHRARAFPVVASYDSWLSRKFVLMVDARLTPTPPPSGWVDERPETCGLVRFIRAVGPDLRCRKLSLIGGDLTR